ncbi:MAG: hypothetical protein CFE24_14850 [Flavobacterium sp. BFFFF2]|nr:MAG: hypothetical protein CFE24_14850 [Flavobacterium sp. BFFFF2]
MKKTTSKPIATSKKKSNSINENQNLVYLIFESKTGKSKKTSIPILGSRVLEPYVSVKDLAVNHSLLLSINHSHLQTLIDLTNLSNLFVLGFDENLNFIGVSIVGEKANAPFQLLNQGKYFLIISQQNKIDFAHLKNIIIPKPQIRYKELNELSNQELVERYNKECGNSGWSSSRGVFLMNLKAELHSRKWDISQVLSNDGGLKLSSSNKCKLVDNKLVLISK